MIYCRSDFVTAVNEVNSYVSPLGLEAILYEYTDWSRPNSSSVMLDALDKMVGDYQFTCPTLEMAQRYADTALPSVTVYQYFFDHRSSSHPWPNWTGVLHGDEIAYVFGEPLKANLPGFNYTAEEQQLSRDMMTAWSNFAKTGDPNRFADGGWVDFYWPVYSNNFKEYLTLRPGRQKTKGYGLDARRCAFWNSYLPGLLATNDPTAECTSDSCHEQCNGQVAHPVPPPPPRGGGSTDHNNGATASSSSSGGLVTFLLLAVVASFLGGAS